MAKASAQRTPVREITLKVVAIGNSRGVRLPKALRERYAIKDAVVLEERAEGLVLRGTAEKRLSWEETFKAMARERERWDEWDGTLGDGLDPGERW
jgi:antitoxin MazE